MKARKNARAAATALCALGVAGLAGGVTGAIGQEAEHYSSKAKVAAGGTKKKPKPVSASFSTTGSPSTGNKRMTPPATLSWSWKGVTDNAVAFPKCTPDDIEATQSDAPCPAKSLVATGKGFAQLGPEGDNTQAIDCTKDVKIYNGGAGKETLYIYGPGSACAGVGYIPPFSVKVVKKGTTRTVVWEIADYLAHPLPGVEGGFKDLALDYRRTTVKKGKKKVGYLQSNGCKGKRKFTWKVVTSTGENQGATATAGKC